ncbi:MAG: cystathionine gamma-synthase [Actinomycetota bacterium]|nr:cystathionine gamma-synthase [Actinomycetota bacterium]
MSDPDGFQTRAIHAGQDPDPATGAVAVPIYQTSTYAQEGVGRHRGFEYSRTANPTRQALEQCVASLEGARFGLAFASGMAAEDAVLRQLAPGEHLIMSSDGYGGTHRLVSQVLRVDFTTVDLSDLESLDAAWRDDTRLVWVESPTNPTLGIVDIAAVAAFAHERGAWCVVDNTFATPYLQRPLELGADVVVHSATKYLGGHSDVIGGVLAVDDPDRAAAISLVQRAAGAVPGPFDCFLVLRGIKTLAVRMDRHCANAAAVAGFLEGHPAVGSVRYPGLPDHPGHHVAAAQMGPGFGGMVSFTLAGGPDAARALLGRTRLFTMGESLGGVESLLGYPAAMSHASVAGTPLAVDPALVRLSVGIEDVIDLTDDLGRALDGLR